MTFNVTKLIKNINRRARDSGIVPVFSFKILGWKLYCNAEQIGIMSYDKVQWYFGIMELNKPIDKTFCKTININ